MDSMSVGLASVGFGSGVGFVSMFPNVISEKVGTVSNIGAAPIVSMGDGSVAGGMSSSKSKSAGIGNGSFASSVVAGARWETEMSDAANFDCMGRLTPARMFINAPRNSPGTCSGALIPSYTSANVFFVFVSVGWGSGAGGGGGANARLIILGTPIVNNGLPVRTINVVVAIYNGTAANTNIANTNPPNPCNFACNTRFHVEMENMSNPNRVCNIAHITNT